MFNCFELEANFFPFLVAPTVCWGREAGWYAHCGGRAPAGFRNRCVCGTEVLRQQDRLLQGGLAQLLWVHRAHVSPARGFTLILFDGCC